MMDTHWNVLFLRLQRHPIQYTRARNAQLLSALSRLPLFFHPLQLISTSPQS